jgi:TatA/E family protein of Tat protein translocase
MIGSLGVPEILFIFILALLVFGPKRLPEIGRMVGRGMAEFRKASNELKRTINAEIALEEEGQERTRRSLNPVAPAAAVAAVPPVPTAVEATVARSPYASFGPDVIITPAPRAEDEPDDDVEPEADDVETPVGTGGAAAAGVPVPNQAH